MALGQLLRDSQQSGRRGPETAPVFHTCDQMHEYWDEVPFNRGSL
jgi:hypothetical protein